MCRLKELKKEENEWVFDDHLICELDWSVKKNPLLGLEPYIFIFCPTFSRLIVKFDQNCVNFLEVL